MKFNRRYITLTAGTTLILEWLSQGFIIASETGNEECYARWAEYLGRRIVGNSELAAQGNSPKIAFNIFHFYNNEKNSCNQITEREYMRIPEVGITNARFMEASITFLYLHELGHHVLGHITNQKRSNNGVSDLERSRKEEYEADRWAILTAYKADYSLMGSAPLQHLLALIGGNSIEAERKSSHPLGFKRTLVVWKETLKYCKESRRANITFGDDLDGFIEDLESFIPKLEEEVIQLEEY